MRNAHVEFVISSFALVDAVNYFANGLIRLYKMPNQVLTIEPQNELKFKGKCVIDLPHASNKPLHWDLGSIHRSRASCWQMEFLFPDIGVWSGCGFFRFSLFRSANVDLKPTLCIGYEVNVLHSHICTYRYMWTIIVWPGLGTRVVVKEHLSLYRWLLLSPATAKKPVAHNPHPSSLMQPYV